VVLLVDVKAGKLLCFNEQYAEHLRGVAENPAVERSIHEGSVLPFAAVVRV
jgi:hypothetical protein